LERHAELLRALPAWTLRLLVPRHKTQAIPQYQAAFREQLTKPLEPSVLDATFSPVLTDAWHGVRASWSAMSYRTATCVSCPWRRCLNRHCG